MFPIQSSHFSSHTSPLLGLPVINTFLIDAMSLGFLLTGVKSLWKKNTLSHLADTVHCSFLMPAQATSLNPSFPGRGRRVRLSDLDRNTVGVLWRNGVRPLQRYRMSTWWTMCWCNCWSQTLMDWSTRESIASEFGLYHSRPSPQYHLPSRIFVSSAFDRLPALQPSWPIHNDRWVVEHHCLVSPLWSRLHASSSQHDLG